MNNTPSNSGDDYASNQPAFGPKMRTDHGNDLSHVWVTLMNDHFNKIFNL